MQWCLSYFSLTKWTEWVFAKSKWNCSSGKIGAETTFHSPTYHYNRSTADCFRNCDAKVVVQQHCHHHQWTALPSQYLLFFESDKYRIGTNPNNNLMMRLAGLSSKQVQIILSLPSHSSNHPHHDHDNEWECGASHTTVPTSPSVGGWGKGASPTTVCLYVFQNTNIGQ